MDLGLAGVTPNRESSLRMSTAIKPEITDWHELLTAGESNEGVFRVPMETLRRLEGRQRVGKHILSSIEDKLKTLGLGHLPKELPNRQQQNVLLYRVGTPASVLVQAVRDGLTESPSTEAYDILRRVNSLPDPDDVVSKDEIAATASQDLLPAVLKLLQSAGMAAIPTPKNTDGKVVDITDLLAQ
jgi:hypothetical protein